MSCAVSGGTRSVPDAMRTGTCCSDNAGCRYGARVASSTTPSTPRPLTMANSTTTMDGPCAPRRSRSRTVPANSKPVAPPNWRAVPVRRTERVQGRRADHTEGDRSDHGSGTDSSILSIPPSSESVSVRTDEVHARLRSQRMRRTQLPPRPCDRIRGRNPAIDRSSAGALRASRVRRTRRTRSMRSSVCIRLARDTDRSAGPRRNPTAANATTATKGPTADGSCRTTWFAAACTERTAALISYDGCRISSAFVPRRSCSAVTDRGRVD